MLFDKEMPEVSVAIPGGRFMEEGSEDDDSGRMALYWAMSAGLDKSLPGMKRLASSVVVTSSTIHLDGCN